MASKMAVLLVMRGTRTREVAAARSQRAEFATRPMADLLKADRKRKQALVPPKPTELQRGVEAPPPWHPKRWKEDERLRWAGEVADLLLGLDTPTTQRAKRAPDPRVAAMRMCGRVRAATVAMGEEQLPKNSEEVLVYVEHSAPSVPQVAPSSTRFLRRSGRSRTNGENLWASLALQTSRRAGRYARRQQPRTSPANSLSLSRGSRANCE